MRHDPPSRLLPPNPPSWYNRRGVLVAAAALVLVLCALVALWLLQFLGQWETPVQAAILAFISAEANGTIVCRPRSGSWKLRAWRVRASAARLAAPANAGETGCLVVPFSLTDWQSQQSRIIKN